MPTCGTVTGALRLRSRRTSGILRSTAPAEGVQAEPTSLSGAPASPPTSASFFFGPGASVRASVAAVPVERALASVAVACVPVRVAEPPSPRRPCDVQAAEPGDLPAAGEHPHDRERCRRQPAARPPHPRSRAHHVPGARGPCRAHRTRGVSVSATRRSSSARRARATSPTRSTPPRRRRSWRSSRRCSRRSARRVARIRRIAVRPVLVRDRLDLEDPPTTTPASPTPAVTHPTVLWARLVATDPSLAAASPPRVPRSKTTACSPRPAGSPRSPRPLCPSRSRPRTLVLFIPSSSRTCWSRVALSAASR